MSKFYYFNCFYYYYLELIFFSCVSGLKEVKSSILYCLDTVFNIVLLFPVPAEYNTFAYNAPAPAPPAARRRG